MGGTRQIEQMRQRGAGRALFGLVEGQIAQLRPKGLRPRGIVGEQLDDPPMAYLDPVGFERCERGGDGGAGEISDHSNVLWIVLVGRVLERGSCDWP